MRINAFAVPIAAAHVQQLRVKWGLRQNWKDGHTDECHKRSERRRIQDLTLGCIFFGTSMIGKMAASSTHRTGFGAHLSIKM